jgi:hypothetical protein
MCVWDGAKGYIFVGVGPVTDRSWVGVDDVAGVMGVIAEPGVLPPPTMSGVPLLIGNEDLFVAPVSGASTGVRVGAGAVVSLLDADTQKLISSLNKLKQAVLAG